MVGSPSDEIEGGCTQWTTGTTPLYWYIESPLGEHLNLDIKSLRWSSSSSCRIQAFYALTSYTGQFFKIPSNTTSSNYTPKGLLIIGGNPVGGIISDIDGDTDYNRIFEYTTKFTLPEGQHILFKVTPEVDEDVITKVTLLISWNEVSNI